MPDFVIKNGTVVDGSGGKRFRSDVAISGDRIEAIEPNIKVSDCKVIDAKGKIVCPGFVDPHSHADLTIYREDHADHLQPLVKQGITTFVGGNCGMSLAPTGSQHTEDLKMYIEAFTAKDFDNEIKWNGTASFMDVIEKSKPLLNTALLAPHGLLRIDAMGRAPRYATHYEVAHMAKMLEESMEAGALGLSTGLQYLPGLHSSTSELIELGAVVKRYEGIYASHLRSYMNTLPEAIGEVIKIARTNDIRAQISHMFWVPDLGPIAPLFHTIVREIIKLSKYFVLPIPLDSEIEKQLERLNRQRARGLEIYTDAMPTTTSFTHLFAYFPPWAVQGTKQQVAARLANPQKRKEMLYDIENGEMIWPHTRKNTWSLNLLKIMGWECVRIMSVVSEKNKHYEGRKVVDIAAERGQHPFDTLCDLLIEEEARVLVFGSPGEPEDEFTERANYACIKDPNVPVSTDTILLGFGRPSYLFNGAFPKFFARYVREKKMISLEDAVRKTSALPAHHFRLKRRGQIKQGWFADVLVIDYDKIAPNCTFQEPFGTPIGIDHVFINGKHVLNNGIIDTTDRAGRLLRRE